jgi:hypothetical protein
MFSFSLFIDPPSGGHARWTALRVRSHRSSEELDEAGDTRSTQFAGHLTVELQQRESYLTGRVSIAEQRAGQPAVSTSRSPSREFISPR